MKREVMTIEEARKLVKVVEGPDPHVGRNYISYVCRGCGKQKKHRASLWKDKVGPRECLCIDCGMKLEDDVIGFDVSLGGRVAPVRRKGTK